jgi:hypothetical protein
MFSNTPAPKAMLFFPILLLATVGILSFLVIRNMSAIPTGGTDNYTSSSATPTSQQSSNSGTTSQSQGNSLNDALAKVPISGYPENTCPEAYVKESNGNRFALADGNKYSLSSSAATWIEGNCPETETLNY